MAKSFSTVEDRPSRVGSAVKIAVQSDDTLVALGAKAFLEAHINCNVFVTNRVNFARSSASERSEISLLILDLSDHELHHKHALAQLSKLASGTRVVVRLAQGDFNCLPILIKANIAGVILKNCAPSELLRAVQKVLEGSTYVSTRIQALLEQSFVFPMPDSNAAAVEQLTKQEMKVLELVAEPWPERAHDREASRDPQKEAQVYQHRGLGEVRHQSWHCESGLAASAVSDRVETPLERTRLSVVFTRLDPLIVVGLASPNHHTKLNIPLRSCTHKNTYFLHLCSLRLVCYLRSIKKKRLSADTK